MHGVKRLFAWMIPRFDRERVQRLARQPAPQGSVRGHARAVRRRRHLPRPAQVRPGDLHAPAEGAARRSRPTSCTCTATAPRRSAGCAPAARHSGHPARARQPHRHAVVPEGRRLGCWRRYTDLAIARLGVDRRVHDPRAADAGRAHQGRLPRRAARRVRAAAIADEIAAARRGARASPTATIAVGTVTRLMPSKGNEYLVAAAPAVLAAQPRASASSSSAKASCRRAAAGAGRGARSWRSLAFRRLQARRRRGAQRARRRRLPVAVGGHAAHRLRGAGDGQADRRPPTPMACSTSCTDGRDALVVPKRDAAALARGHRPSSSTSRRWPRGWRARRARTGARYDIAVFVRKMERLYELLHETSRRDRSGRRAAAPTSAS